MGICITIFPNEKLVKALLRVLHDHLNVFGYFQICICVYFRTTDESIMKGSCRQLRIKWHETGRASYCNPCVYILRIGAHSGASK